MARCKDWGLVHDHAHGTTSGWGYHGCRCDECKAAHYAYHQARDRARMDDPKRRACKRNYLRRRRAEGHPAYTNHGGNDSHRKTGWFAQKRHYAANSRDVIGGRQRERTASFRESVGAQRKKWWSPEEDALVLREDINLTEMAYMLSRTPSAIAQRRHRLRSGARRSRYYRSDIECLRGHSRAEHGRHNGTQWTCRACQRLAKERHQLRKEQAA